MAQIKTKRERVKFASDNVTGACPEVLDAILKNNDGDRTPYGNDQISLDLQNKVVDTSGAGDAFNGAFATALCEGQSVNEAIKFANCYAGISTTRIGTANSMPSREEIDKIL